MSQSTLFFIGLIVVVAFILGVTVFAGWIRTKLIWSPVGRMLVSVGFSKANGTIDDLKEGKQYIVTQSFVDYFNSKFEAGETLTYLGQEYIDHLGHVIHFNQRTLNLNERKNAEVLRKIWAFLEPVRS